MIGSGYRIAISVVLTHSLTYATPPVHPFEPIRRWLGITDVAVFKDAIERAGDSEVVALQVQQGEFKPDSGSPARRLSSFHVGGSVPFDVFTYYSWLDNRSKRVWLLTTSHASNWVPFGVAAPMPIPSGISGRRERVVACSNGALILIEEHEQRESTWQSPFDPVVPIPRAEWLSRVSRVDLENIRLRVFVGQMTDASGCRTSIAR